MPEEGGAHSILKGSERSLESGLEKSRRGFMTTLRAALRGAPEAEATWEQVEEALIAADVGAELAIELVERARRRAFVGGGAEGAVKVELVDLLLARPHPAWAPRRASGQAPAVVLVVGVNGTGKTTTIAKLAHRLRGEGHRVLLAAADTFRAAGIEQLQVWAERVGAPVVAHAAGADPAAVVYDALDAAVSRNVDVVIADTAGRMHTKHNLMEELAKIRRTIEKRLPGMDPDVLFVLDATTGQNGLAQAHAFHEATGLSGIVLTKLDSTARGGIVFAIEHRLGVPVLFVGVGERLEDLLPFDPQAFVEALFA
ncbi:MAG TPA: signal recognition particle-docking protein FtsY [Candidatus Limnocylindrales bacterium]|jgi:fused signal recognition particle receptor|nr:signal recognition particle-docking protein FtsY [Candidatus Limnocylindrales bacterium]